MYYGNNFEILDVSMDYKMLYGIEAAVIWEKFDSVFEKNCGKCELKSKTVSKSITDNSASIDWIILHKILDDKWAVFQFMGISFENTDGIKKIIGMVGILIYATHVISNDFNFSIK